MDLNPLHNISSTPLSGGTPVSGGALPVDTTPRDSFQFTGSTSPGIIDPRKIATVDSNMAVLFTDARPGVNEVWAVKMDNDKDSKGKFVRWEMNGDSIYMSRSGTTRKLDMTGKELWSVKVDADVSNRMVFDKSGNLYVAGKKELTSVAPDGGIRWKKPLDLPPSQYAEAPFVFGDTVYLKTSDKKLTAYTTDGEKKWTASVFNTKLNPPVLDNNGLLYFNVHGVSAKEQAICIDTRKADASGTAEVKTIGTWGLGDGPVVSDDGTLYGFYEGKFRASDAEGKEKWAVDLPGGAPGHLTYPRMGPDGNVYVFAQHGGLTCIQPDGSVKWHVSGQDAKGELSRYCAWGPDGSVYTACGSQECGVIAIGPDGNIKWNKKMNQPQKNIQVGPEGTVYSGGGNYRVRAFNPADGSINFEYGDDDKHRVHMMTPLADGDILVSTVEDSTLRKLHVATKEEFLKQAAEDAEKQQQDAPTIEHGQNSVDIGGAILDKRKKKKWGYIREFMSHSLHHKPEIK